MPKYDSLLLNCGGGIINRSQQSKQYRGAAALAIGIGGTGVAALAELKQKVYQQLERDARHPNSSPSSKRCISCSVMVLLSPLKLYVNVMWSS